MSTAQPTSNISFLPTGKPGKTIHLLKAKSKPFVGGRNRKKVPVLGSIQEYQAQKVQKSGQNQSIDLFASLKKNKEGQKPKAGKDAKMNE